MLTAEGEFEPCEGVFFEGCNVTNTKFILETQFLCTLNDEAEISKLMIVDIEQGATDLVIDQ